MKIAINKVPHKRECYRPGATPTGKRPQATGLGTNRRDYSNNY